MRKTITADNTDSARNENLVPSTSIKKLVESYIINKEHEADFKKQASAENTQIKELMGKYNLSEVPTDLGTAKLTEQVSTTFIEDELIKFLKENNLADDIVKTKEYVDYDALESALYHDKLTDEQKAEMSKCQEHKTTLVLRISKKKGE